VIAGWASASRLQRLRLIAMKPSATSAAHPKCSDGIAANWLATDSVTSLE
jgi:hypothetical protein